ncbi:MAG TPA: asparagine--tRNA ligase [Patescibacteria group bacterium]
MKKHYVSDLRERLNGDENVTLYGWIKAKRRHGNLLFLDVADSTGSIQVTFERGKCQEITFETAKTLTNESSVKVQGQLRMHGQQREISAYCLDVINKASIDVTPHVRDSIDIFDPALQEQLLSNRHFYLRNERVMAIMKFRHMLMGCVHHWFRAQGFIEITAPVLTPISLYDDRSAIALHVDNQDIFLTQCVGFYLEWAVHAFERVYNIGPSFRGEESHSKRHLMEYWHIKAETAFADFEDVVTQVESLISHVTQMCCERAGDLAATIGNPICCDGSKPPYPRILYSEAVEQLQRAGAEFEFGKSLGSDEEELLAKEFHQPFWIVGIPRSIEPFPYVIDQADNRVTRTADLIATNGFGELLGVAEKIHDLSMLDVRLEEKGKAGNPKYEWMRDLRKFGCVPHVGFGLGVERFIRWLTGIPHVRDTIPYPRTFRRRIFP